MDFDLQNLRKNSYFYGDFVLKGLEMSCNS